MSATTVEKIFNQLFGSHHEAQSLFEELVQLSDKEHTRVQLAVLKLSEGDAEKLKRFIDAARIDFRDVLAWAEYPQQLRTGATRFNTPQEEYEAILAADRQQYESWLEMY